MNASPSWTAAPMTVASVFAAACRSIMRKAPRALTKQSRMQMRSVGRPPFVSGLPARGKLDRPSEPKSGKLLVVISPVTFLIRILKAQESVSSRGGRKNSGREDPSSCLPIDVMFSRRGLAPKCLCYRLLVIVTPKGRQRNRTAFDSALRNHRK